MDSVLNYSRKGPESGVEAAIIFVHGYGADGKDLLGLADIFSPHLMNVAYYAPDAPDQSTMNPMGYQWFPIPWIDGSSEVEMGAGIARASDLLDQFINDVLAAENIPASKLFLVGFSQGTMISLDLAPKRTEALGGIVGFSGRLMRPSALAEAKTKPPIFLAHGTMDPVVPYTSLAEAQAALAAAGFEVRTHSSAGMAHGIGPDGMAAALEFLKLHLDPS